MSEIERSISRRRIGFFLLLALAIFSYGPGQVPGVNSATAATMMLERWKSVVLATGKVDFHEVDRSVDPISLVKLGDILPVGRLLLYTNEVPSKPMIVLKRPRFDRRHIAGATTGIDEKTGRHYVDVRLIMSRAMKYDSYPRQAPELVLVVDGIIVSDIIIPKFNNPTLRVFGITDPEISHLPKPVVNTRLSQNWN